MQRLKVILMLVIIVLLSLIFAQQYDKGCSNTVYSHFFELIGVIYTKGFIEFLKNFSWSLLVLLLFILPNCTNKVKELIELIGMHLVNYGKAINQQSVPEMVQQSKEEQRAFQKEKGKEIADTIEVNDKEKISKYKQRRIQIEKLEQLICEDIQQQNIDGFTKESKVIVENDPISLYEKLYFDCSYRYKGQDRARRYVNTLFITGMFLSRMERIYKYVRIMDDINNQKNNQRFIVEIICLELNANEIEIGIEMEKPYEMIQQSFQKAISKGILAIKKYKLENGKAILLNKDGWVLDTVPKNINEVNTNKEQ